MPTTLVAIGGAADHKTPGLALREAFNRAGGAEGRWVIVPTASSREDAGTEYATAFAHLGLKVPARILPLHSRAQANHPDHAHAVREASGVFFTGGNQVRLSATLGGTAVEQAALAAFAAGTVMAGSSAGTAILSAVMLAFGKEGATPRQGQAQFVPGLGFTRRIIFDQHFQQRNRWGRLLFAVSNHPGLLGVGVDENTAAIVEDEAHLHVVGEHGVVIVDGRDLTATDVSEIVGTRPVALSNARVHVLTHGCSFDLDRRTAYIPAKTLVVE